MAQLSGYDPRETLPALNQWTIIELFERPEGEPPFIVAQWIKTPPEAAEGWVCDSEPDEYVWFVSFGSVFNWWTVSDVRRWFPLLGGER